SPPVRVVYGPQSTDEMAELWIQAAAASEGELPALQEAVARKAVRDRVQGWEHLVAVDPGDAVAHANLAAYHESRGDTDRAVTHYRRAVDAEPAFAQAHHNLALALERAGDPEG